MDDQHSVSRRDVLKSAVAIAASTSLPRWFVEESIAGQPQRPRSGRPRIALIGCGGRGRGDAKAAAQFGEIAAVCDVDDQRIGEAKKLWPNAASYRDFRRVIDGQDIDVVICGTVDHWHTLIAIAAMRAGKDVYCEKPLTLTIDEGKHLVEVAKKTRRILQTGSQQRSDARFRLACELVRNGRIGKLTQIDVFLPMGRREGPFMSATVPDGFDWDMWMGSTPNVEYIPERTHVTFRYWWEYSGGTLTDWGAHHNDIALWGLNLEHSGPTSVKATPLVDMIPGGYTASSQYEVKYTYANGVVHNCRSTTANGWNGIVFDPNGQQNGVKFIGKDGWVWVTRKEIEASNPEILVEPFPSNAKRLPVSNDHMANFFECVQSREEPIANAATGHRSVSVCHLGVIALRLGRELQWDPQAEAFVDDSEANGWLAREMRSPWKYDSV
jgi:predicted dehydrogenase